MKPRRGLLQLARAKPKIVRAPRPAVDCFGELSERKRVARRAAERLGHSLRTWHRRPNDPAGRWNAFCERCNMLAVVCVEAPEGFDSPTYGSALRETCRPRR